MEFFGVGAGEAVMILLITLLVVGPSRFPHIAREGGKYYRMARRYADEVMQDVRGAMEDLEKEVGEPGAELRSIREIGRDLVAGGSETTAEIRRIGTETRDMAAGDTTTGDTTTGDTTTGDTTTAHTAAGDNTAPAIPAPKPEA